MHKFEYFTLSLKITSDLPEGLHLKLFSLVEKNRVFISPNASLCGIGKEVHLESESLAIEYIEKLNPIFLKRYGDSFEVLLNKCQTNNPYVPNRIKNDSKIVTARINQNIMTPNKKSIMES
jgi:hypothetical protein